MAANFDFQTAKFEEWMKGNEKLRKVLVWKVEKLFGGYGMSHENVAMVLEWLEETEADRF